MACCNLLSSGVTLHHLEHPVKIKGSRGQLVPISELLCIALSSLYPASEVHMLLAIIIRGMLSMNQCTIFMGEEPHLTCLVDITQRNAMDLVRNVQ
jgi:hypothetical protein